MFIAPSLFATPATQLFLHRKATIRALFKALLGETILVIYKCTSLELVEVTGVFSPHAPPATLRRIWGRREKTGINQRPVKA